jgi:hypothetical protein
MTAADARAGDTKKEKPTPPGHLVIQVHDEDAGGPPLSVSRGPGEKMSKVVAAVYAKLETTPKPEDRLTCLATGEDVRQYGDMHLRDYASGKCSELVWTFVRDTGGAGA